tara:strand:+ start:51 stop:242 length:192 start_codon:yes stop_codon:yes gene_type:complete
MLEKYEILIVIIALLLAFYFVISRGSKVSKDSPAAPAISKYMFGVRILIGIIAIVSLILWLLI